jgi:uncharacterized protein (TIGR03382 family)
VSQADEDNDGVGDACDADPELRGGGNRCDTTGGAASLMALMLVGLARRRREDAS